MMVQVRQIAFFRGVFAWGIVIACLCHGTTQARLRSASLYRVDSIVPNPLTVLLRDESVQRELRLESEQRAAVGSALDEADLPLWRLRDRPPEERGQKAEPLLGKLEQQLSETLTARQFARLGQLLVQAQGMRSLLAPQVAKRLSLTSQQSGQIRSILDAMTAALAKIRQQDSAPARRIQLQAEARAVALLNERQRGALMTLMGRGFDLTHIRSRACRAPAFDGVTAWIGSDPLKLDDLRGKVVVVHFYTFGCINCIRNLPHYNAWREHFDPAQMAVIGIHTPESEAERDIDKVKQKAAETGITYPVAVDNDRANWNAWANHVWPSVYLIDKQGFVRYWWYGELNWQETEGEAWMRSKIAELLAEQPPVLTAQASRPLTR